MGSASEGTFESSLNRTSPLRFRGLPKMGKDVGAGRLSPDQYLPPRNPAESVTLKLRKTGTRNGITPSVLSALLVSRPSRCQPDAGWSRIPQEAKARGNVLDMLTWGR